jgi:hypothetical protein
LAFVTVGHLWVTRREIILEAALLGTRTQNGLTRVIGTGWLTKVVAKCPPPDQITIALVLRSVVTGQF